MKRAILPASTMLVVALLCGGTIRSDDAIIAVKAGVLIDGTGGQPIKDAVITIEGDRITRISSPSMAIPSTTSVC